MNFHVLTLFPEMIMQGLSTSIIGRAAEQGILSVEAVNIRDYTKNKHKKVDDYPYGGGAGMLMQAQPVYDAWKSVADRVNPEKKIRTVYLTPQGTTFTQPLAKELAQEEELIFLCGHYEGIDERVLEEIVTDYVSIGDYVLTGGELPAMVMIDAISRMVPGVLGNEVSGETESFEGNLLEHPQYSRPEVWMGKAVPQVLMSGNQRNIRAWRKEEAVKRTRERRPDLYLKYEQMENCSELLKKQKLLHIDMTELIARGQAKLVYAKGAAICLLDTVSGIYFHTAENEQAGRKALEALRCYAMQQKKEVEMLILHQDFMQPVAAELFGLDAFVECRQAVYTRKEKLPITGLYSLDEKKQDGQIIIRKIGTEYLEIVTKHYESMDDPDYIRGRMEKGWMYGAFIDGALAGFIGMHAEGSLGMLQVLPEYRGRKVGKALETYMINLSLEFGHTPFGQVKEGNEISTKLQESLGLYFSKSKVFWMVKHPEKL